MAGIDDTENPGGAPQPREDASREAPVRGAGGGEPHAYWPSYQHMGDCAVCGHLRDSPLHVEPPRVRRDLFDV